jgi:hypothetical protein
MDRLHRRMRTGHGHAYKDPHRVKMREVAGVFRARDAMEEAVTALLSSGFDRADIGVMVGAEARGRLEAQRLRRRSCRIRRPLRGARTRGGMALQTAANDKRSSRIRRASSSYIREVKISDGD